MPSTSYTDIFGGATVQPSQVSYASYVLTEDITLVWPTSFVDSPNVTARIIDVEPTLEDLTLTFPDATEISVGYDLILNNVGENDLTVNNNEGSLIFTSGMGSLTYLYLIDNTTTGGTWRVSPFAGGSSAVTQVAATTSTPGFTITGSPITSSGTLDFELSLLTLWNAQTANTLTGAAIVQNTLPGTTLVTNSTPLTVMRSTGHSGFVVGNDADYTYSEIIYPTNASQLWYLPTQTAQHAIPSLQSLLTIWNAQADKTLPVSKLQNSNQFISAAGYFTAGSTNPVTIIKSLNIASIVYTGDPDFKYRVTFTTPASNGIYVVGSILTAPSVVNPLTFMWNTVDNSNFDLFIRPQSNASVSFMVVFQ